MNEMDPYMQQLELLVYGYCRQLPNEYDLEFPAVIIRMCYLWYHPNTISLRIRTMAQKFIRVDIIPTETVYAIKEAIQEREGIPAEEQRLVIPNLGKPLRNELHVYDYNLHTNMELLLILVLRAVNPANTAPVNQTTEEAQIAEAIRRSLNLNTDTTAAAASNLNNDDVQLQMALNLSMQANQSQPALAEWVCSACTFINSGRAVTCVLCTTAKP